MRQCTLILVFNPERQILLNMKKRWFGEGKFNWAWWKVEAWETILEWAKRELQEETMIDVSIDNFEQRWLFHFYFENKEDWNQDVTLFVVKNYSWEVEETEEMKPTWFNLNEIPYDKMWEDDKIWLPRILAWEIVEYDFNFNENWNIINYNQIK